MAISNVSREYAIKEKHLADDYKKKIFDIQLDYNVKLTKNKKEVSDSIEQCNKKVTDTISQCEKKIKDAEKNFEIKANELQDWYERQIESVKVSYMQMVEANPHLLDIPENEIMIAAASAAENHTENRRSIRRWLSNEEYNSLTPQEKNILAFERWKNRRKTKLEIGHEYEMFIGNCYRKKGWQVEQFGINRGLEDLGRDIVAMKWINGVCHIHIVQCKRWATEKPIRENTICQIFGTTLQYSLNKGYYNNPKFKITPVLATTSELSDTAKDFAEVLKVKNKVAEMGEVPWIKCNINHGRRIYHLPFDQQYEHTEINYNNGEFYAFTIQEAEARGFVHALRHIPN